MLDAKIHIFQYDIGLQNVKSDNVEYDKLLNLDRYYVRENGNFEYLIKIYKTGKMLETNTNQGYHPPLHHYIAAGVMRICDLFGASDEFKVEAAEFPAFIYSIFIIVIVYQITKELDFKDGTKILVMLLVSFNPLLIYISRQINNDPLVTLCIFVTFLYLIKWYKNPNMKYTIFLALAMGCGASSKVSIIVMMLPLLVTYLIKMNEEIDDFEIVKKILIYGLVFGVIATPLIFWYPVRNAIKFGQPPFGVVGAIEELDVAHTDFANRWLINNEFFADKLENNASNVFSYVINSSIIFIMDVDFLDIYFFTAMKIITVIFLVISIVATIKHFKDNYLYKLMLMTQITWLFSFISFNVSLPSSCTMHSRYIVIMFLISILFIAKLYESTDKKWLKNLIKILAVLYSLGTINIFAEILYII